MNMHHLRSFTPVPNTPPAEKCRCEMMTSLPLKTMKDFPPQSCPARSSPRAAPVRRTPLGEIRRGIDGTVTRTWQANDPNS